MLTISASGNCGANQLPICPIETGLSQRHETAATAVAQASQGFEQ
jgi:hypothetical protein